MAATSGIPGDSNDGGPKKNPRDESKKPQEEVAKTLRGTCNPLPFLPDELLERIIVLSSRWEYPKLSLVSQKFRLFIASPRLYDERSKVGKTETFLYALIRFPPRELSSWYILNFRDFRLRRIESLANDRIPHLSTVVTIGLYIYVIGGFVEEYGPSSEFHTLNMLPTSSVLRIDCRTHKYEMLPSLRTVRFRPAAGVIDGKIYVMGGGPMGNTTDWAEVFDVNTQVWSPVPCPNDYDRFSEISAVMEDKIYLFDSSRNVWQQCFCVADDVLFIIEFHYSGGEPEYSFASFDPKERLWRTVTIFGLFRMPDLSHYEARMANLGGNLVILGRKKSDDEIWCIEITLKRGRDGNFRGTIVTEEHVLTSTDAPYIEHCRVVTI